jgi:hypothetical protein
MAALGRSPKTRIWVMPASSSRGTRGGHVSRALVVVAEDELGLPLDLQEGRDVGVCAEMAEHFTQAAVQRAVRVSVG